MLSGVRSRQSLFVLAVVALYATLLLTMAASRLFDFSIFIFAGDRFVAQEALPAPIAVTPNSLGYDGQFYYRLALAPLSFERSAHGVTLDEPAKRMQRILYPTLARLVSFGQVDRVPASLLIVNLIGIGVLASVTAWFAGHGLAWWLPLAILGWPGFLSSLTLDTAEITSAALMLSALACYLSNRLAAYCILAMAASLTRETTLPIFLGVLIYESYAALAARALKTSWGRIVPCALVFIPFAIWWATLSVAWGQPPQPLSGNHDIGWPFVGLVTKVLANLSGVQIAAASPTGNLATRAFVVATLCGLAVFCANVVARLPRIFRIHALAGPAIGWVLILALMSLLTANGPLIESVSYFRAFTECWVVGCLLLAHLPARQPSRKAKTIWALAALNVNLGIWQWVHALHLGYF